MNPGRERPDGWTSSDPANCHLRCRRDIAQPGVAGTQAQPSQKKGIVLLALVAVDQVDLLQRNLPGAILLRKKVSTPAGQGAMTPEPVGLNHKVGPRREFARAARENF